MVRVSFMERVIFVQKAKGGEGVNTWDVFSQGERGRLRAEGVAGTDELR